MQLLTIRLNLKHFVSKSNVRKLFLISKYTINK